MLPIQSLLDIVNDSYLERSKPQLQTIKDPTTAYISDYDTI